MMTARLSERKEDALAHWHKARHQPLPGDSRENERQQRHMAFIGEPEAPRPRPRHVGIEFDMMAECVQLSCEIQDMKPPVSRDRDIELSRHRPALWLGSLRLPLFEGVAASNRGDPGCDASRR